MKEATKEELIERLEQLDLELEKQQAYNQKLKQLLLQILDESKTICKQKIRSMKQQINCDQHWSAWPNHLEDNATEATPNVTESNKIKKPDAP